MSKKLIVFLLLPILISCTDLINVRREVRYAKASYNNIKGVTISHLDVLTPEELKALTTFDNYVQSIIEILDQTDINSIDIDKLNSLWKLARSSYIEIRVIAINHLNVLNNDQKKNFSDFDLKLVKIDNMFNEVNIDKAVILKDVLEVVIFSIKIAKCFVLV